MTTHHQTEHLPAVPGDETAPELADQEQEHAPVSRRKRRPVRTSLILFSAITVVAAGGAAATGAFGGDDDSATPSVPSGPAETAELQRTTLTSSETVEGTLGYGDATTVQDASGSASSDAAGSQAPQDEATGEDEGAGIVTWTPAEGTTLKRGDTVYGVDGDEVPLLYGPTPLYRTLEDGSEGDDVEMLERNLEALGYTGFTVNEEYTAETADAVAAWQEDLGREETGTVEPGDAVVADGARRVATLHTSPGAVVGGEVLDWTGTERIVTVELDAQLEDLVKKGTEATVELPNGETVKAQVTDVGTPPTSSDSSSAGSSDAAAGEEEEEESTLPVELEVKDQKKLGRYQAAAVDVVLDADSRKDVLAVPVNALLAQPGGGYAIEVVRGNRTDRIPVELGMFANGMVEVTGDGLEEGMSVGVPT